MDRNHFDVWTRRHFGLAAGSALAALFALRNMDEAGARRRRCLRQGRACLTAKRHCCGKLACDNTFAHGTYDYFCCKVDGAACTPGTPETPCCSSYCDADTKICKTCRGRACAGQQDCCPLWDCEDGFCGGCADFGWACTDVHPCCSENDDCTNGFCGGCVRAFSPESGNPPCPQNGALCCDTECNGGICVSEQGGPCARDVDCRTCYENFPDQCDGACDLDTHTCV
jgi:hypothetical protein